jgi:hypothetical protein
MEKINDFDTWLLQQSQQDISTKYYAIYESESGIIKGIWPDHAASDEIYKVEISNEMAESIFSGNLNPSNCIVDLDSLSVDIIENNDVMKITSVLHRVIEKKNSKSKEIDIHISYKRKDSIIFFDLSTRHGGKYIEEDLKKINKRKLWDLTTVVDFLITDYNDPNILHTVLSFKISEMTEDSKIFNNIVLPEKFSIFYTNRIFKNYVFVEE